VELKDNALGYLNLLIVTPTWLDQVISWLKWFE
jgi:hypothetical protein